MPDTSEPRHVEVESDSVEEAIQQGLDALGLTRAEVTVEVLDEGGRGVLGFGRRPARVRLTEGDVPYQAYAEPIEEPPPEPPAKPAPAPEPKPRARRRAPTPSEAAPDSDDDVKITRQVVGELLDKMAINAALDVRRAVPETDDDGEAPWVLDIQGEDLGVLIGRRGETLNALQYITRLIASREVQRRVNVVLDVESYKTRREVTLRKLAQRMAEEARHRGRAIKLEPMPPNERRIIHIALRDDPTVETESEGMGDRRKVTIIPRSSE